MGDNMANFVQKKMGSEMAVYIIYKGHVEPYVAMLVMEIVSFGGYIDCIVLY